jgi:drug/metabolite transporter (DMT)-like permease
VSPTVAALALLAAVLHATWNAALRSGADRLQFVTVMSLATTVAALPFAVVLPLPAPASWPYLAVSALVQAVYIVFLAAAYRYGELGQVYPVVRGSVPLLVTLGGFFLAGQRLGSLGLLGLALISSGIISLALRGGHAARRSLGFALLTATFVACYVIADALGVRRAGSPAAYTAWIWLVYGALMPLAYWLLRRSLTFDLRARDGVKALIGGMLSFGSYGAVVLAFSIGNVGAITALRETSIVFATLIGRVFLGEALTPRRVLVCLAVTAGAVCIGLAR